MKAIVKVIECVIYVCGIVMMSIIMVGALNGIHCNAAEPVLKGKTIVMVKSDKPSKPEAVATGYNIEVKGKMYPIFKGPRGGYFYIKDGKKVYLTAAQKALIAG